ncbi:uncharacterized protein LOC116193064 isoform X1 [Punica granatum]|uniref:Phosphorylated adapter RNA export protein n=1 Tax=Punica granatum TaxID=22663 RepID=A0A6P8C9D8_PUNGR|nr:uncharacterized protein LOC116193064 isoform X1 [Punica granatum]
MEEGGKMLEASLTEDEYGDIEMLDAEEGELVDPDSMNDQRQSSADDSKGLKQEKGSKNRRRRANKKKNKRKRSGPETNVTDINRFVIDTCKRLREKKSYMVYTAVGCLGVSALSDIVREVDAIQACGGQVTADGKRQRTGGGILWGIIKVREPNAYREIMKRAKEFEQFKPQNPALAAGQGNKASPNPTSEGNPASNPEASDSSPHVESQGGHFCSEETRKPIKDRMRVPVSYEDIVGDAEGAE